MILIIDIDLFFYDISIYIYFFLEVVDNWIILNNYILFKNYIMNFDIFGLLIWFDNYDYIIEYGIFFE